MFSSRSSFWTEAGHKLTAEVMEFVAEQRAAEPSSSFAQLAELVEQKFKLQVHPRSIQRQLLRKKTPLEHHSLKSCTSLGAYRLFAEHSVSYR
jgi:hypothetical protein